jgi:hypothetical protein
VITNKSIDEDDDDDDDEDDDEDDEKTIALSDESANLTLWQG